MYHIEEPINTKIFPKLNFSSSSLIDFNIKQKLKNESIIVDENSFSLNTGKEKNVTNEIIKKSRNFFTYLFDKISCFLFYNKFKPNFCEADQLIEKNLKIIHDKSVFKSKFSKKINYSFIQRIFFYFENKTISNPLSYFCIIWAIIDLIINIQFFLLFPLIFIFKLDSSHEITTLNIMNSIFITLDIIKSAITYNFRRGILNKDLLVTWNKYFSQQFFFDFIVLLINILLCIDISKRFLIICFIIRLKKLKKIKNMLQLYFLKGLFYILIKIIFIFIIFCYYSSCLWLYINEISDNSWIKANKLENETNLKKIIYAFYFILSLIRTLKFYVVNPQNIYEIIFSCLFFLFFFVLCIYLYSLILLINKQICSFNDKYSTSKKTIEIQNYLKKKKIDYSLQFQIQKYFKYSNKEEISNSLCSNNDFLNLIPKKLKKKLCLNIKKYNYLKNIKIFSKNFSNNFLDKIDDLVIEELYKPNTNIFKESDINDKDLFIILDGEINIEYEKFGLIKKLKKNSIFGEYSFFSNNPRNFSAKSLGFTSLLRVKREIFLKNLKLSEANYQKFKEIEDKINIHKDYSCINLKCYFCEKDTHLLDECSIVHYVPNKFDIILNLPKEKKSIRNIYERRSNKCRFHMTSLFKINKKNKDIKVDDDNAKIKLSSSSYDDISYSADSELIIRKISRDNSLNLNNLKREIKDFSKFIYYFEDIYNFPNYFKENNLDFIVKSLPSNFDLSNQKIRVINIDHKELFSVKTARFSKSIRIFDIIKKMLRKIISFFNKIH